MSIWKQTGPYQANPSVAGVAAFSFFNKWVWLVFQESIFWRGQEILALWNTDGIGCLKKRWRVLSLQRFLLMLSQTGCLTTGSSSDICGGLLPKETGCVFAFFIEFTLTGREAQCLQRTWDISSAALWLFIFSKTFQGCWWASMVGPGKGAEGISPINRIPANSWEAVVNLFWA